MPKRDPVLLVGDIRACLRQVAEYIRGMDLDAFRSDRKTIDTELIWEIASKDAPDLAHLLEGRTS